jgi:hypothetical protein
VTGFVRAERLKSRCFPGAAQHEVVRLQTRDRYKFRVREGPGSAVHRYSAWKTRVNALLLHHIRETTSMWI